ncbi:MAG: hypothetical protein CL678_16095 [Bdellovibrionaceae bacterium]|nr:hypothetical protein [Pseudobdellovibrionaceae bacterium]|tara:strand:+ start:146 stop:1237 length:1092 start_codon:yes stop_codon:yes gene_type:complete
MYNLFNDEPTINRGGFNIPQLDFVRRGLDRELYKIQTYYRERGFAVRSDHLIVRLLNTLSLQFGYDVDIYYDNVVDQAYDISRVFKLTSPLSVGEPFSGRFYGKGYTEVMVSVIEDVDPLKAVDNWENLEPIRVIRHPQYSVLLNPLQPSKNPGNGGLVVMLIDIPLLALQYRGWRRHRDKTTPTGEPLRTVMQFVAGYVLPNMLGSHMDIAMLNRMNAALDGYDIPKEETWFPFMTVSYHDKIDRELVKLNELLLKNTTDFVGMLKNIPTFYSDNMLQAIRLPSIPPTRQVVWGLVLARLPVIAFLLRHAAVAKHYRNRNALNEIRRSLVQLGSDKTIQYALPSYLYAETVDYIDTRIAAYL